MKIKLVLLVWLIPGIRMGSFENTDHCFLFCVFVWLIVFNCFSYFFLLILISFFKINLGYCRLYSSAYCLIFKRLKNGQCVKNTLKCFQHKLKLLKDYRFQNCENIDKQVSPPPSMACLAIFVNISHKIVCVTLFTRIDTTF